MSASATTTVLDFPMGANETSSYSGSSTHYIQGGCLFSTYDLTNGSTVYLGQLRDGVHNCGYRYINSEISYYDQRSVGYGKREITNGQVSANSYTTYGGYNILQSWDSGANNAAGYNVRNIISAIDVSYSYRIDSNNTHGFLDLPAISNGYALFGHRWFGFGAVGTQPRIERINDPIQPVYLDGHTPTSDELNTFWDFIDEHTYMSCTVSAPTSLTPSSFSNFWRAYNSDDCYILSYIPLSSSYTVNGDHITYIPALGDSYRWTATSGETLDTSGYFYFLGYSDTYRNNGSWNDDLKPFPIIDMLQYCETAAECAEWSNYVSLTATTRSSDLSTGGHGNNTEPVDNIYSNWFNIFSFGITFPFSLLFNQIDNGSGCSSIPTIGGMLGNPNAQYCSWWSSDIRNITTPIFQIGVIMLIFGFIISWLRSDTHPLGKSNPDSTNTNHGQLPFPTGGL